ncbi:MAG TPA: DUF2147 domain-containing protein [Caulobacteraceae bacterium]|nr:DUF2147 domain-containing protein [Caulobacteraceae bacterium]
MRLISALFAATAVLASAGAAQAADITGLWATDSDNGKVQIYNCGEGICGKLVDADQIRANPNQTDRYNKNKSLRSRKVKGLVLFSGYTGGPTEWKGGAIYDPKSGDTGRNGKLRLNGDKLEVKGCLGPICRTKHWTRAG